MANRLYRVAPALYDRLCALRREASWTVRLDPQAVNALYGKILHLRARYPALQLDKSSQED